jgi:starch phosphorylase
MTHPLRLFLPTEPDPGKHTALLARMRESMARLTPQFSSNRALRQYTEQYYLPMATAYRQRADAGGALGTQLLSWQRALAQHWLKLHFGDVLVERVGDQYLFRVQVYLDDLPPEAVQVELYADPMADESPVQQVMSPRHPLIGALHGYLYSACVPASRPVHHYTPRIVPHHAASAVPLEAAQILWQR